MQQGFVFDNVNRRLFVVQRRDGTSETAGDLCVTQLDFDGNQVGYMYLTGFGHGVSIGAQAVGTSTYLWTETDASTSGYGTRLARFKFTSGTTLTTSSSALTKYTPVAGATSYTCATDPVNDRLIVRYLLDGDRYISVHSLSAAASGDFSSPLSRFVMPTVSTASSVFQGYTAYGQYLYVLTGTSYEANGNIVDSEVTAIDLNTGKVAQGPVLTQAGSTLSFREPEGMAVYRTVAGEVRLFLGFASGEAGDRRSNLFYKNALV
ncbi:teichoic acid biosynthesis protein C [Streptomyces sp. NPDC005551]|uniref:phage baseplate protein n=1 Tax=Streptomyces sp. NPDC005551 TaxID=3364725 RepID=UPI003689C994